MPKLLEQHMSREEFADEIVKHARAGESWALLWIGDRYWPKSARLEIADESSQARYEGPYTAPFMSSQAIESAVQCLSDEVGTED